MTDPTSPDPGLINDDIRPTRESERTWSVGAMAPLWVGMVVCVPTYMLAGSMIPDGMNWWQAVGTVMPAMVGFWATLSLNIPDFTRYEKTQRDQVLGQFLGLPLTIRHSSRLSGLR